MRTVEFTTQSIIMLTTNLNAAVAGTDMEGKTIENILLNLDMKNTAVRNNGGGFTTIIFWEVMSPNGGGLPTGDLLAAIEVLEVLTNLKLNSVKQDNTIWIRMGLVMCSKDGKLEVCGTPNQDNPLMPGVSCGGTQF
jgi:Fe-Mn family superoxide dismutase